MPLFKNPTTTEPKFDFSLDVALESLHDALENRSISLCPTVFSDDDVDEGKQLLLDMDCADLLQDELESPEDDYLSTIFPEE